MIFRYPCNPMYNGEYRASPANSYMRFFNASPNLIPVDIYANGKPIVKNLSYLGFSPYFAVVDGNYNIEIFPAGKRINPILKTDVYITKDSIFNVAIIGLYPAISLYPIPEPVAVQKFGRPCIRFINLSPNSPRLDILVQDGSKIFSQVGYKDITQYACVQAGKYTFTIYPTGVNKVLAVSPNTVLEVNKFYTMYGVGLVGEKPVFQLMITDEPRS